MAKVQQIGMGKSVVVVEGIKRDLIQLGPFGFKTGISDPSQRGFCAETISLPPDASLLW